MLLLTRRYIFHGQSCLLPAVDLINTAEAGRWNVDLQPKFYGDYEEVKLQAKDLPAGEEILIRFCPNPECDNSYMLAQWGIYLEANTRLLQPILERPAAQCDAPGLRKAAEASLRMEEGALQQARDAGWASPRCTSQQLASPEQGVLRCSLARLAWERCAEDWGYKGWRGFSSTLSQLTIVAMQLLVAVLPGAGAGRWLLYSTLALLPYAAIVFWGMRRLRSKQKEKQK
eukprot:TRINITY_DN42798_c0_g1_i1.p1 TRINITY_DN42798_c0_g1~~TRINITY_DN42798_c0_g1_i1.p1  ORF type:complete len:229 (+),score=53.05 TRINITY_DN42798_c0_g1_i1:207-893(+)